MSEQVSIANASKNLSRVQSETSMTEGTLGLEPGVCTGLEPGLAALRLLGQVRYSRDPRLGAAVSLLSSPRFRLASSATGSARLRAQSML